MGAEHFRYGDPYTASCVGKVTFRGIVNIMGLAGATGYRQLREVERSFRNKGFDVSWKRIKPMDAEIRMSVTINGTEQTVLTQKFNNAKELTEYQCAIMDAIKAFAMARIDD